MILDVLKSLLSSKKFLATLVGIIVTLVAKIGWDVPEETVTKLVGLLASYVVGQGIADAGKEKAIVEATANDA